MSDDIVFIKDENDYVEYSKLKPVNTYKYKKVKFICTVCKNESTKSFRNLKIPFKCRHCTIVENNTSKEYRDKFRKTCLLRYGVEHPKKCKAVNDKAQKTCMEKYGVTSYLKTQACKDGFKKKYNVDNPLQVQEIKAAIQKTCIEKYGQPHYSKTEESINKHRNTFIEKYGAKTYKESDEYYNKWLLEFTEKLKSRNFNYIKTENKRRYIKCLTCNNIFSFSISGFNVLLKKYKESFCPYCTKILSVSHEEKELSKYIETIYNGSIINNIKTILPNNKEIDIYLPDLKLGFEFDGTYWHADPRFYNENDLIWHKKVTASEIWKRDNEKNLMAELLNILLIHIKEYDWIHDNEGQIKYINEIIENRKNELSLQK